MKLVIDIPEEDYKSACKREFSMDGSMLIYNAIRKGTKYKERPHGKIVKDENGYPMCSRCGEKSSFWNFCPRCGADFREENENEIH